MFYEEEYVDFDQDENFDDYDDCDDYSDEEYLQEVYKYYNY